MRVLASTTAGTGHFLPMVGVLRACLTAGHEVLVACPASFAPTVSAQGFVPAPFDDAPAEEWGAVMARLPGLAPDEANAIVVREVFGRIDTTAALPGVTATMARWRPDLVVRDPSEFASWLAAEQAGVPHARVSISLLSVEARFSQPAAEALSRLPAAEGTTVDAAALVAGTVLAAAPATLDPADGSGDVQRYGEKPLRAGTVPVEAPAGEEPLVYVTFGTVAASLGVWPGTYRAVLDGLADLPVRVLVTTGTDVDPADLGPLPPRASVSRFVPQDAVLAHASLMVTHGGFGTVLGGLRAGVPMVLAPLFADQADNAARIATAGAGVVVATSFDPGTTPPGLAQDVRDAAERLLVDPGLRATSRDLAREMAGHPPVATLVPALETLAGR